MKKLVISIFTLSLLALCLPFSGHQIKTREVSFKAVKRDIDFNKTIVLNVVNMEDYIYLQEEDGDPKDLVNQFEDYCKDELGFKNVTVVYDTTSTNESLFSEIKMGKTGYDVICPSDYMIQKMIAEDYLAPLDWSYLISDNAYEEYGSTYIRNRLESIEATNKEGETVLVGDYAVGYMWGTLGMLINPYYSSFASTYDLMEEAKNYSLLWNKDYYGTMSIKDSMRDTYCIAVLEVYKEELQEILEQYENNEIDADEYNAKISEIFNRCDNETIEAVRTKLNELKSNIYGLEVDSGKSDIVQGKIGINVAWSGDAVYSMELGVDEDVSLVYSIPELGSNIWFDGWVLVKGDRTEEENIIAHEFLNFLCMPENARQNMEYTGYTSFIGGDDILDLIREWYDVRAYEINTSNKDEELENPIASKNDGGDFTLLTYDDCLSTGHDSSRDDDELWAVEVDDDNNITALEKIYLENSEEVKTYGDLYIVDEDDELDVVDLNYVFNTDYLKDDYSPNPQYYFYTEDYFFGYENEEEEIVYNNCVGNMFFTQYPDEDTIARCAVMKDFGAQNEAIVAMWEKFRSSTLPTWAIVIFVVEIVGIVGLISYFAINKRIKLKMRQKRKETTK